MTKNEAERIREKLRELSARALPIEQAFRALNNLVNDMAQAAPLSQLARVEVASDPLAEPTTEPDTAMKTIQRKPRKQGS